MDIDVQEVLIGEVIIKKVKIEILSLIFNNSVTFRIRLNPDTLTEPTPFYIKITGNEYKNWKNDDTYIINLLLSKINLTPIYYPNFLADPYILDPVSTPIEPVVYPVIVPIIEDPTIDPTIAPTIDPIV